MKSATLWHLQRYTRAGGISGEGVKNLLEASGFKRREDLIAREAIQNSVDAHDDVKSHKVKVIIRKESISGARKREFVSLMGLDELAKNGGLIAGAPTDSPLRSLQADEPLGLLYIEDFNTVGLGGGLSDLTGNYYRLLFLVGDAQKAETNEDLGGSYGYGKSVYSSNSATSTIVTFSVFKPTPKTENSYARLLGSTFQKSLVHKGVSYTGRGWYGGSNIKEDVPDPIVSERAIALAAKLGFQKRTKSDHGTSILLIGTKIAGVDLSIEQFRNAIETWWWPRILDDRLDVELIDQQQTKDSPRPKQRLDLRPYIDCYQQLTHGVSTEEIRVDKFNAQPETGFAMGSIALTAVAEDVFGNQDPDAPGPNARRVAMMRGPLMVVDYHPMGSERRESFVGVYRASADINNYLRLSEPKEHNRWDEDARRLQMKPHGKSVINAVYRRCNVKVREFQALLAPKKERPQDRLATLDRLMGAAFASKKGGKPFPTPTPGKAFVEFPGGVTRRVNGQQAWIEAEVRMKLKPDQKSPQHLKLKPDAYILEDSRHTRGRDPEDQLEVTVIDLPTGKKIGAGVAPIVDVQLTNEKWTKVRLTSQQYAVDWLTELSVTVE